RFVVQPKETSADPTDSAGQTKQVPLLFFDLQIDVDRRIRGVHLDFSVFRLDFVEIRQLIQTLHALLPQRRIEHLAFVDPDLEPDLLLARGRVARKRNTVHDIRLVFFDIDAQIHNLVLLIETLRRNRREIDITLRTVQLPQLEEIVAKLDFVEDVAGS